MQDFAFDRAATGRSGSVLILNTDGTPATNKVAADLICRRIADDGSLTTIALTAGTIGAYVAQSIVKEDDTLSPGSYHFDFPTLPATGDRTVFVFTGTGLRPARAAVALLAPALTDVQIADALLDRNMSAGPDTSNNTTTRTVRQALRTLRNRFVTLAGVTTFYKEDDVTASHTSILTGTPTVTEANPPGGS
jgi:hypothetical protein